jgi:hypothetical protein
MSTCTFICRYPRPRPRNRLNHGRQAHHQKKLTCPLVCSLTSPNDLFIFDAPKTLSFANIVFLKSCLPFMKVIRPPFSRCVESLFMNWSSGVKRQRWWHSCGCIIFVGEALGVKISIVIVSLNAAYEYGWATEPFPRKRLPLPLLSTLFNNDASHLRSFRFSQTPSHWAPLS